MTTHHLLRVGKLPSERHELPPYRVGHWVLAGTPVREPYPCVCWYDPCRYERCPDRTRNDRAQVAELLPPGCCGRPDAAAIRPSRKPTEATEAPGGYASGGAGGPGAPRGSGETLTARGGVDARTSWERRLPTTPGATTPGAAVADDDLWGPLDDAPPSWDAIDEASPVHGEGLEDPEGHSDTPEEFQPLREVPEELWGIRALRRRVAEAQCDCRTPWDGDPPTLLVAASAKAATAEASFPLSGRAGADVRAEAEDVLFQMGHKTVRAWKQGRHTLLPPTGKTKTRECWHAPLDTGGVAVVDLPPEKGSGVHCADCCQSFQNSGAWELHRKRQRDGRYICVDPAEVWLVPPGSDMIALNAITSATPGPRTPMLKRSIGGVWAIDPLAVWGSDGPPLSPEQANTIYWDAQRAIQARPWQFGRGHNRQPG